MNVAARAGERAATARPRHSVFLEDVLAGLALPQKRIPSKYFYDAEGSALFEEICELPEYYLTRAEATILARHAGELARLAGPGVALIELGSGSSAKTRIVLDALEAPRAYVPVDLSDAALAGAAAHLRAAYPLLDVLPLRADFTGPLALPPAAVNARRAVFFPGSTVGNLEPLDAVVLLGRLRRLAGRGGLVIVGVDVKKDVGLIERAYNDARGVTAAFNRNVLSRIRRELGSDIDPEAFDHAAHYAPGPGRIEMHLRSRRDQLVRLDGSLFRVRCGETLHTENSYKYAPAEFTRLALRAGLASRAVWHDAEALFSVHVLLQA